MTDLGQEVSYGCFCEFKVWCMPPKEHIRKPRWAHTNCKGWPLLYDVLPVMMCLLLFDYVITGQDCNQCYGMNGLWNEPAVMYPAIASLYHEFLDLFRGKVTYLGDLFCGEALGGHLVELSSYQCSDSHYKDYTIPPWNGNPYTGKTACCLEAISVYCKISKDVRLVFRVFWSFWWCAISVQSFLITQMMGDQCSEFSDHSDDVRSVFRVFWSLR